MVVDARGGSPPRSSVHYAIRLAARRSSRLLAAPPTSRGAVLVRSFVMASDDPHASGALPSTRWSRILGGGAGARRPDWDALARAYERPIRDWLRSRFRGDADAAADAAQEFFAWMIETEFAGRADPERGRFRSFLKTALRHFVVDRERAERTRKRGGGRAPESLDDAAASAALASKDAGPDEALDAAWRTALIERALAALERDLAASGRESRFLVFRDYFLSGEAESLDHATLARRYGLSATDVSNYLRVAKNRFRELLRLEVLATVGGPDDLGAELRWIFAAVDGGGKP
jgi:RNA polymerase sigma-70 factor (ECF subfamily)